MGLLSKGGLLTVLLCSTAAVCARQPLHYSRSALYSVMVIDPSEEFSNEFSRLFEALPLNDKYDDHSIGLRTFRLRLPAGDDPLQAISRFLATNQVGKRLVAKWFNRNRETGCFDMHLVAERGYCNASALDVRLAQQSAVAYARLGDTGERLIGNTFVVLYRFDYSKQLKAGHELLRVADATVSMVSEELDRFLEEARKSGYYNGATQRFFVNLENLTPSAVADFQVDVTCYLFRLVWDETTANTFYANYWWDRDTPTELARERRMRFDGERELFALEYLGASTASSQRVSVQGCRNNREILLKLFARVMDRNLVELQRKYEVFKVKVPVLEANEEMLTAEAGLKEGITPRTQFEVLEILEHEDGTIGYERVGVVEPVPGKIWDNRYGADQEQAPNAMLGATTFRVISGKKFYPGMVIREIRFSP